MDDDATAAAAMPASRLGTSHAGAELAPHRRSTSRQSTTSINSGANTPYADVNNDLSHDRTSYLIRSQLPSAVWQRHQREESMISNGVNVAAAVPTSFHNDHNASFYHSVDPNVSHSLAQQQLHRQHLQQQERQSFTHPAISTPTLRHLDSPVTYGPLDTQEGSLFDAAEEISNQDADEGNGSSNGGGSKRKKRSSADQQNATELRKMFRENMSKDLAVLAQQVLRDEEGPRSEKSKQIFGMIWLNTHVQRSPSGCVPRGRVHAAYTARCAAERIPPLNPASFGKLLRILFPDLKTRRLGMRGESKYHYVQLSLVYDEETQTHNLQRRPDGAPVSRQQSQIRDAFAPPLTGTASAAFSASPHLPQDTAYFSPSGSPRESSSLNQSRATISQAPLYLHPSEPPEWGVQSSLKALPATMIYRPLDFGTLLDRRNKGDENFEPPDITPFLPIGTDIDAVNSLTSVYRSHCHLAIDNFRFCKTDKFSDSYKSLVGLLTVPGQKLLAHPRIAEWVKRCDWLKYQHIVSALDKILLSRVPKAVMQHVEKVALNLGNWISHFFQSQPVHLRDAMRGPAGVFTDLLKRFLRVNRAALDVDREVMSDENARQQLWDDWVAHSDPLQVMQSSLSRHGHRRMLHILTQEIRTLLSPPSPHSEGHYNAFYSSKATSSLFDDTGELSNFQQHEHQADPATLERGNTTLARLYRFLVSLPSRFPHVNARAILTHLDIVGGNLVRNFTLGGAQSLPHWWRVKLFVDEAAAWLAEKGGLLSGTPETLDPPLPRADSFRSPLKQGDLPERAIGLGVTTDRTISAGDFGFDEECGGGGSQYGAFSDSQAVENGASKDPGTGSLVGYPRLKSQASYVSTTPDNTGRKRRAENKDFELSEKATLNGSKVTNEIEDKLSASKRRRVSEVNDDSGIGLGAEDADDFELPESITVGDETKYHSFIEGVNGSDPADIVVC